MSRTGPAATIVKNSVQVQIERMQRQSRHQQRQEPMSRRERSQKQREEKRQMQDRQQRERILSSMRVETILLQEKLDEVRPLQERMLELQKQAIKLRRLDAIEERLSGIEKDRVDLDQAQFDLDEEEKRLRDEKWTLHAFRASFDCRTLMDGTPRCHVPVPNGWSASNSWSEALCSETPKWNDNTDSSNQGRLTDTHHYQLQKKPQNQYMSWRERVQSRQRLMHEIREEQHQQRRLFKVDDEIIPRKAQIKQVLPFQKRVQELEGQGKEMQRLQYVEQRLLRIEEQQRELAAEEQQLRQEHRRIHQNKRWSL
ncbi:hypothetical protein BGW39_011597 [Mortierella sp. 14UC]|nr:hypothetical protein BGW39_011597 [Mortierella sp. 14UC]